MEQSVGKPSSLRNFLVRFLLFGVLIIGVRFAYIIAVAGESCNIGDFCFFSLPQTLSLVIAGTGPLAVESVSGGGSLQPELYTSKDWIKGVRFYSSAFQDLIAGGYLSLQSKSLCVETPTGRDVSALREIGVKDAVGIARKGVKPLVKFGRGERIPFGNRTFDFVFSGEDSFLQSAKPADFAAEIDRTLKPGGVVKLHGLEGFDSSIPYIREIVLKKECGDGAGKFDFGDSNGKCYVPGYKHDLVKIAEPLISEEPLKPWITLKRNVKNIKYLPSMADISFKNRYLYVDVGARSYGSSIGSWFRKQYPKQNKTFHVYAIEADKTFHQEYALKKGITLVPYAAWVKNETLTFEIHRDPGEHVDVKGRGMGRIRPVQSLGKEEFEGEVEKIQGFDFAEWLKKTVTKNDFVVMKMDVEGTEFDLIPRLFKTGAICLIDEIFLECHYNRWQRCCPGQRSAKYEKTYAQCLQLFNSLRQSGVLVHQWW
ncbi:uncharacterized protein LOC108347614 isoform X2 [Vigna angularis]|uniref:uncharacterized protein LOC108347614 isoform X2 n=1 Tax=Phaseolus angularis TaxID=3914 RepID=UPI0022B40E4A|nr:uncharacterized protein LOC108347614 isoform X2 [Vigna angularis]